MKKATRQSYRRNTCKASEKRIRILLYLMQIFQVLLKQIFLEINLKIDFLM